MKLYLKRIDWSILGFAQLNIEFVDQFFLLLFSNKSSFFIILKLFNILIGSIFNLSELKSNGKG
jgi:hypothetical protein